MFFIAVQRSAHYSYISSVCPGLPGSGRASAPPCAARVGTTQQEDQTPCRRGGPRR